MTLQQRGERIQSTAQVVSYTQGIWVFLSLSDARAGFFAGDSTACILPTLLYPQHHRVKARMDRCGPAPLATFNNRQS